MKDLKLIDIHGVFPGISVPMYTNVSEVFTEVSVPMHTGVSEMFLGISMFTFGSEQIEQNNGGKAHRLRVCDVRSRKGRWPLALCVLGH